MNQKIKNLLELRLKQRTVEQLKNDIITAQKSEQSMSNTIFVLALSELETRISKEEYTEFESSL